MDQHGNDLEDRSTHRARRQAIRAACGGVLILWAIACGGCIEEMKKLFHPGPPRDATPVPPPLHLLLPAAIDIHPFTGTRTFDAEGGVKGIEVRVTPRDAYGDATKAFGTFRFELYEFHANRADPKGERRAFWDVSVMDPKVNRVHWDVSLTYKFRLEWDQAIPVGRRFVLVAIFSSPFTKRLFAERKFIAGE